MQSDQSLDFFACSENLVKLSLLLAIVASFFVISSLALYFLLYPFVAEPFALLYTALLAAAVGWFSFMSLVTATPVHKIEGDSIRLAGWHPMSDFGEIALPMSQIEQVKKTNLLGLLKMGWFHGRVHALNNFVEIDLKDPIRFDTHWEALHQYRVPPWYKKKIDKLVVTVTNPDKFLAEIRKHKDGAPV